MKTIKVILIILLVSLLTDYVLGQEIEKVVVKGSVRNGQTKLSLEGASITLRAISKAQGLTNAMASAKGEFKVSVEKGYYDITISFVSFQVFLLPGQQIDSNKNLGVLMLQPETKLLDDVEVLGMKPSLSLELDRRIFYVGSDLSAKGGTANDVLNNVPSVNVDSKGNISLRGQSDVRILINGKPSVISANNGLEQLSASSIEKIEVINNPSAKYEAQGTAGIINIVLKKNMLTGLNGSVQATWATPANHNGNINLSYKTAKVNLFGDIGFRYRDLTVKSESKRILLGEGKQHFLKQETSTDWGGRGHNFYIGGDYYIDSLNTLTASFYHSTLLVDNRVDNRYDYFSSAVKLDSTIQRFELYSEPKKYNQLEVSYVKAFEKKDKNWTTSLRYDFWHDDENQDIRQSSVFPTPVETANLVTQNIESSNDIYIQSDYVNTVGSRGKFEAGSRVDLRAIRSDYWATANGVLLEEYDNKLKYNERLVAGYFQWSNTIKKWSYQLGLRTELSLIEIADGKGDFNKNKRYIDIFPTIHLSYRLQDNSNLQLGYSRRIDRPEFPQLNPFGGLSDLRNLIVGNADLNPAYTHAVEFTFLQKLSQFTFNPTIYYKHTNGFFQYFVQETGADYLLRSPVNMNYEKRYGLELNSLYNPLPIWRIALNFNYYGFNQQGEFNGERYFVKSNRWTAQLNSRLRLPTSLLIESVFTYTSQFKEVQSLNSPVYKLNIALSKDILNERMTVSMAFNNVFNSLIEKQILNGSTYRLESKNFGIGRVVNATATYRFNRKKEQKDRLPT
ncbi:MULTISPECIES: outer membrane beta-barrel protein [Sphingobacterium]|uniref:outer membrane beta-barrel protein n=1 Tax=Sphingobacterium TaxID=28453 RepID=UPI00257A4E40|nr:MULTISPECIES: outer membrane beta-barrel protein [Sphingobacterium]